MQVHRVYQYPALRNSGVYQLLNTVNGRCYIGEAHWMFYRVHTHCLALDSGKHSKADLQRDWVRYGGDAFEFNVLQVATNWQSRLGWEAYYIIFGGFDLYNSSGEIRHRQRRAEAFKASLAVTNKNRAPSS